MVQVKKVAIRDAITRSALSLFSENGYSRTTIAQITDCAGITTSNFYRYYDSKLDVFFAVFGPWLHSHLDALEQRVMGISDPNERLREVFTGLWYDIPHADNGFNNNIVEALAAFSADERYSRSLLIESEQRVWGMVASCVPEDRWQYINDNKLTHLMFMAGDGFALNVKLGGPSPLIGSIIDMMCAFILGKDSRKTSEV